MGKQIGLVIFIFILIMFAFIFFKNKIINRKKNNETNLRKYQPQPHLIPMDVETVSGLDKVNRNDIEHLKNNLEKADFKIRLQAVEGLAKIREQLSADLLLEAMADKNEEVKLAATDALKKVAYPGIADKLVEALKDPNKWIPARVAEVLVSLGSNAVSALQKGLKEKDPVFKSYLIEILGEIGDKSATSELHNALLDNNAKVRLEAVKALGKIGNTDSAKFIVKLLQDPELKVRVQAIRSLGLIGGFEAMRCLDSLKEHQDPAVRYAALEALRKLNQNELKDFEKTKININYH